MKTNLYFIMFLATSGCAFIQPSSAKAPIADVVGSIVMSGASLTATGMYVSRINSGFETGDLSKDTTYTATIFTLAGAAILYSLSAWYGFSRDPKTQNYDDPIIGLLILSAGLGAFGSGLSAASHTQTQNNDQGCCSYHGGVSSCIDDRVMCNDGNFSPTCHC